ncbi:retrovirus-related Pol polyprotein from transposon TNT 1-94 [Lactuca sativa]|uniref:retrovirus-related Pol polyprotein from transposon TNT 1-94 n=1 Tax=Lactuca sativa TaxID=4236 RepID=UPI000CD910A4|nr:retrovirus-related Pol polyprotein from transposon TNT 1-94 [Lactuca sativa]
MLDRQALGVVRLSLPKNVAYNIVNEKTTYGLIKGLSNMYEKPSATNKVHLIQQLVNLKMKEGGSVTDHVNEFNSILSRLTSVEIKFEDEVHELLLLSSLPKSWLETVTTINSSAGGAKLTFESIRDSILGEDVHRRSGGESSNNLLSTEGHFRNQCPKPVADKGKNEMNIASDSKGDALICAVENLVESWIMDSGLGDVVLKTTLGMKWDLKNFKFILDLKRMLISVELLDDEGHRATFDDHQWKVTKGHLVVAGGQKRSTLYMVEVSDDDTHAIEEVGASTICHQRLGHMSDKDMTMLASKERILDLKNVTIGFCEPYVIGKQKKVTFAKIEHPPKTGKLELVYSDVYGPTSVASVGGSRYYVTFIDDYTRKVWVYFL